MRSTIARRLSLGCAAAVFLSHGLNTQTWAQINPPVSPPVLTNPGFAFDEARGLVVMFGGTMPSGSSRDTWLWNGSTWTQAAGGPEPRAEFGLAYDRTRERVVLFGGQFDNDETWEWDGASWMRMTPATRPPARMGTRLVYDSHRRKTVVFGGHGQSGTLTDTWEWNGTDWTRVPTQNAPPFRVAYAMAYDPVRRQTVLFGGHVGSHSRSLNDTWAYDGSDWHQLAPATSPSPRASVSLAFDDVRSVMILVGGSNDQSIPVETWEWNGTNWSLSAASSTSPQRRGYGLAYDTIRNRMVLFGGDQSATTLDPTNETWELVPRAGYDLFGTACAGTAGLPNLTPVAGSLPRLGQEFTAELTTLPAAALNVPYGILGATPVSPIDLTGIGMPSCTLYVKPDDFFLLRNTNGTAIWPLAIPNNSALVGATFFQQGFVIDPGANPLGGIMTNAGRGTIGKQ